MWVFIHAFMYACIPQLTKTWFFKLSPQSLTIPWNSVKFSSESLWDRTLSLLVSKPKGQGNTNIYCIIFVSFHDHFYTLVLWRSVLYGMGSVNLYLVNARTCEIIDPASPNLVFGFSMGRSRTSSYWVTLTYFQGRRGQHSVSAVERHNLRNNWRSITYM